MTRVRAPPQRQRSTRDPRQSTAAAAEIKRNYDIYHNALAELIQLLGAGKINEFFDQPTQGDQDGFEKQYVAYMEQNDRLYDIAVSDKNASYSQAMWILVGVMIVVLAVIFAVWVGIKASLVAPMNRLIDSIRHSAGGDLVKPIEVDGSNEMGQLAESLRHMQGELMRTVGDVRNGANAIYNNASYSQALWILVGVLIVVLAVSVAVWCGINASLVAPMNRLIDSIRHIAGGDLVKPIVVDGSN